MKFDEVLEYTKKKAQDNNKKYLIYENVSSAVENDFVVSRESYGVPCSNENIGKIIKIHALIDENGNLIEKLNQDFESSNYKVGDAIIYKIVSTGEKKCTFINEITERAIKTFDGISFKKSNFESGWGSKEAKILKKFNESDSKEFETNYNSNNLKEGGYILNSKGKVLNITSLTSRQIKTKNKNYRKSDGKVWGGGENHIIKIFNT